MEVDAAHPGVAIDSGNPLLRAVFLRRLRLTRLLLDGGAYVNESDGQGQTPLMVACRTQHADGQSAGRARLVQFLLERGADPNIQDKDGRSALMHACRERAGAEVAALLLDSGADVSLEDRSGASALVHAVLAGDVTALKVLLDSCKAKGKEVIIITTEKFPCGKVQARQYLSMPPDGAAPAPASPSEIQLITSPQCSSTSSLRPPKPVFSFKEEQVCGGASSHPCSPSRLRGLGPTAAAAAAVNGPQQPLLRLNSEPWLKIPASLLGQQQLQQGEEMSSRVPELDEDAWSDGDKGGGGGGDDRSKQKMSLPGLLSSHSASHPNLHSGALAGDGTKHLHSLASSSLHSIIQRRKLGPDIYSSDPQLAGAGVQSVPEEPEAREPAEARRLAPLRCSSTLGSRESPPSGPSGRRLLFGFERRGSGAFLLDHGSQARPRSLPPLTNTPAPHGLGPFSEKEAGPKGFLPSAPPGQPREATRRMLLRRHSMQTEQFKGTA